MQQLEWQWPGGKPIAVIFNICLEAWSDGKAPGISPMGNPLSRPGANASQAWTSGANAPSCCILAVALSPDGTVKWLARLHRLKKGLINL